MDKELQFKLEINFDPNLIQARFKESLGRAQKKLDVAVLKDSNVYCPLYQSVLQKSGIAHTVPGSGLVIWRTPYARVQYYGMKFDHTKSGNPYAQPKWFEVAKAKKLNEWTRLVYDEYNKKS